MRVMRLCSVKGFLNLTSAFTSLSHLYIPLSHQLFIEMLSLMPPTAVEIDFLCDDTAFPSQTPAVTMQHRDGIASKETSL